MVFEFPEQDTLITYVPIVSFEMPDKLKEQSLNTIDNLLDIVKECNGRKRLIEYMKSHYPEQTSVAVRNYLRFYGDLY